MSNQLDHPPVLDRDSRTLSEADARFRQWMQENLSHAADHFGLTVAGQARLGWLDRSISAPVQAAGQRLWLRVVSEDKQWTSGDFWTGNLNANVFTTLPKPQVLDVYEWEEWRQQCAELMTLAPGSPCSPTDILRHAVGLPDQWWADLRSTIEVIAATPTNRVNADQALVRCCDAWPRPCRSRRTYSDSPTHDHGPCTRRLPSLGSTSSWRRTRRPIPCVVARCSRD